MAYSRSPSFVICLNYGRHTKFLLLGMLMTCFAVYEEIIIILTESNIGFQVASMTNIVHNTGWFCSWKSADLVSRSTVVPMNTFSPVSHHFVQMPNGKTVLFLLYVL